MSKTILPKGAFGNLVKKHKEVEAKLKNIEKIAIESDRVKNLFKSELAKCIKESENLKKQMQEAKLNQIKQQKTQLRTKHRENLQKIRQSTNSLQPVEKTQHFRERRARKRLQNRNRRSEMVTR
jgi:LAS superfamily LD-carboxypeptidase LdcB